MLVFNLFNKVIEDRTQGFLVHNMISHIPDINEQYSQKKGGVNFTISRQDTLYLVTLLDQSVTAFLETFVTLEDFSRVHPQLDEHLALIHLVIKIFCQISFLGGYNPGVQSLLVSNNMLDTLYRLLLVLFTNSRNYKPVGTQPSQPEVKHFERVTKSDHHYEIFSSVIRLCANLVHINKSA